MKTKEEFFCKYFGDINNYLSSYAAADRKLILLKEKASKDDTKILICDKYIHHKEFDECLFPNKYFFEKPILEMAEAYEKLLKENPLIYIQYFCLCRDMRIIEKTKVMVHTVYLFLAGFKS